MLELDNYGCYGDTVSLNVNIESANIIQEYNYKPIRLFPNPTKDVINIEIDNYINLPEIKLFDLNGTLLKNKYANKIDLRGYSKGIYFVEIFYDNKNHLFKVIKI